MIQGIELTKSYGHLQVLKGVTISVEKGEVVSIVGASGAGKSTLLHILGTLDRADSGKLIFNQEDIAHWSASVLARFRNRHIGFIFQFHNLLPEFTALENICIPAFIAKTPRDEAEQRGLELLSFLGLSDRAHHKPAALSGGEQQRVAVARSLINQPDIILADEPSGNLDSKNARDLHDLFFQLRKTFHQAFIIVTHNEELAKMADRKLTMVDGRL